MVQQATERAWKSMDTFDPARPFRPWFLRIVANLARNDRRARGRRAQLDVRAAFADARREVATPEDIAVSRRGAPPGDRGSQPPRSRGSARRGAAVLRTALGVRDGRDTRLSTGHGEVAPLARDGQAAQRPRARGGAPWLKPSPTRASRPILTSVGEHLVVSSEARSTTIAPALSLAAAPRGRGRGARRRSRRDAGGGAGAAKPSPAGWELAARASSGFPTARTTRVGCPRSAARSLPRLSRRPRRRSAARFRSSRRSGRREAVFVPPEGGVILAWPEGSTTLWIRDS